MKPTYEDLKTVPDDMTGEIIDGELSSPTCHPGSNLYPARTWRTWWFPHIIRNQRAWRWIILDEPEIKFGEDILVPELAGLEEERFNVAVEDHWIPVAPDWVVKSSLPRQFRKTEQQKMPSTNAMKLRYSVADNPDAKTLEIFRLGIGQMDRSRLYTENDKVRAEPLSKRNSTLRNLWWKTNNSRGSCIS